MPQEVRYNIARGFWVFHFASFGLKEVSESQMPENAKGSLVCHRAVMLGLSSETGPCFSLLPA